MSNNDTFIFDTNETPGIDPLRIRWTPEDNDLWMGQGIRDVILVSREMAYELYLRLQEEFEGGSIELREVVNG